MKFQGIELISRETIRSSRILISTSAITLFVTKFSINLDDLSVLGVSLNNPDLFDITASVIILFQLTSFIFHWFGDRVGHWKWNSEKRVGSQIISNIGTIHSALNDTLEKIEIAVTNLENVNTQDDERFRRNIDQFSTAAENFMELSSNLLKFRHYGWFYVYVWNFSVPLLIAIYSLESVIS